MRIGDGSRASVEAALDRLRARYGDLRVETETVENDPDYFEHGEALAEDEHLTGAGAWVEDTGTSETPRAACGAGDGRVLFVRHAATPDRWGLPGGGHEAGESLAETAVREVREETSVEARITGVWKARHRTIVHRDDPDRRLHMLDVWFDAVAEEPAVPLAPDAWDADDEILEARWFDEPPDGILDPFEERVASWADQ